MQHIPSTGRHLAALRNRRIMRADARHRSPAATQPIRASRSGTNQLDANTLHAAEQFKRASELPKLLPLWPCEIADTSQSGRLRVVAKLRGALRAERQRGLAGHWTYDLARHRQLLAAFRAETAALMDPR